MRKLIVYPNCSKGGVATVIRGRAVAEPNVQFDCVFVEDKGGVDAYSDLPNVDIRIVRRDRCAALVQFLVGSGIYSELSILSFPEIARGAQFPESLLVKYEFHSSNMSIIKKELSLVDLSTIDTLVAPSQYMADQIDAELPKSTRLRTVVVPNLIDSRVFHPGQSETNPIGANGVPLIWIGRFDKEKGVKHFLRLLSLLPEKFYGIVFVSLESDPARAADFFSEVHASGVNDRVHLLMNVPQWKLGDFFRRARERGGALVSTSIMESFGYTVVEAIACALPVYAFGLEVFAEHSDPDGLLNTVDIGDVVALAELLSAPAERLP